MRTLKFVTLIIISALIAITGCSNESPMSIDKEQSFTNQTTNTDSATDDLDSPPSTEVADVPENPPVKYKPAWPDRIASPPAAVTFLASPRCSTSYSSHVIP